MSHETKTNKTVNVTDKTANKPVKVEPVKVEPVKATKPTRSVSEIKGQIALLQAELANALAWERENRAEIQAALKAKQDQIRKILADAGVTGQVTIGADGSVTIPESNSGRGRKPGSGSVRNRSGYHLTKGEFDKIEETGNAMLYGPTKAIEFAMIKTGQTGKDSEISGKKIKEITGDAVNDNQISGTCGKWRNGAREIVLAALGMSVD